MPLGFNCFAAEDQSNMSAMMINVCTENFSVYFSFFLIAINYLPSLFFSISLLHISSASFLYLAALAAPFFFYQVK